METFRMTLKATDKQETYSDWCSHYASPEAYGSIMQSQRLLKEEAQRHTLSSSQRNHLRAVNDLIDGRMN
jgi:thiaminase